MLTAILVENIYTIGTIKKMVINGLQSIAAKSGKYETIGVV